MLFSFKPHSYKHTCSGLPDHYAQSLKVIIRFLVADYGESSQLGLKNFICLAFMLTSKVMLSSQLAVHLK